MTNVPRVLTLLALVFLIGRPAAAQPYEVRIHRPFQVGEKFQLTVTNDTETTQRASQGGRPLSEDSSRLSARYTVDGEVLEVDADGRITRARYVLRSYEATSGGQALPALAAGSTILTTAGDDEVLLEGGQLSAEQKEFFSILKSDVPDPGQPTEDDIFAPAEPKDVGDTWLLDGAAAVRMFTNEGLVALPGGRLMGGGRIAGKRTIRGVPALLLRATMTLQGFSIAELPGTVESSRAVFKLAYDLPIDLAKHPLKQNAEFSMDLTFSMATARGTAQGEVHAVEKISVTTRSLDGM